MHIEIYTKNQCSYCFRAKKLLENMKIQYAENKLGVDFTSEMLKQKYPTATTYPVIVVDSFFIGGYNELNILLEEQSYDNRKLLNEGN
jgi:glutaredoxin 3